MRIVIIILLACVVIGCDGSAYKQDRQNARMQNFQANERDFNDIASSTFKLIDAKSEISTIIVPKGLDPRALAALKKVTKVIEADVAAPLDNARLPAGYFALRTFSIEDGQATMLGTLGPVTGQLTAANIPDCGKNYSVVFFLEDGDWVNHSYKFDTCAESRHWVPVDAEQQNTQSIRRQ